MSYPFDLLDDPAGEPGAAPAGPLPALARRPFLHWPATFEEDARRFVPDVGEEDGRGGLRDAIHTAIALGAPLLITGEPGTGKTQAAYWTAWRLGIEPVLHVQVKSDSTAHDLLYHFDAVRYFHEAALHRDRRLPHKRQFVEKRALWEAMESGHTRLVLIDEIDKAPRDFPNDLLRELDRMEFEVPETRQTIRASRAHRPILFITSNSERRLPEPFLRRCVYHHIEFSKELLEAVIEARRAELAPLPETLIEQAVERFMRLREQPLRKKPATGECLVWLRVLALRAGTLPSTLAESLAKLPCIETLVKDHQDLKDLERTGAR